MNKASTVRIVDGHPDSSVIKVLSSSFGCKEDFEAVLQYLWNYVKSGSEEAINFVANYTEMNARMPWNKFLNILDLPEDTSEIFADLTGGRTTPDELDETGTNDSDNSAGFQIAISYARGFRKAYVEAVAAALSAELGTDTVFIDTNYSIRLNCGESDRKIQKIFEETPLNVVFLSEAYRNSKWCKFEWDIIQDTAKTQENEESIIVVRFDDVRMMGHSLSDGHTDARENDIGEIISYILEHAKRQMKGLKR